MTQTTAAQQQIPRAPTSADPRDLRSAYSAMSDVQDAIRFIPESEFKTFEFVAASTEFPMRMTTNVRAVRGVLVVGLWLLSDEASAVYSKGVHWRLGQNTGEVIVDGIDVTTADVPYRVTLKIEGER